jgi:transposase
VIKELKPGHVGIMDHAFFHRPPRTKNLIESVGFRMLFLPLYPPVFHPIEKSWANMKRWIKHTLPHPMRFTIHPKVMGERNHDNRFPSQAVA